MLYTDSRTYASNGFIMVYWDLFDYLSPEATLLYSYLLSVEQTVKQWNGDYFRLSNSFLQEKFRTWTAYTINKYLDELKTEEYIDMKVQRQQEHGSNCSTRWVKILERPVESNKETD